MDWKLSFYLIVESIAAYLLVHLDSWICFWTLEFALVLTFALRIMTQLLHPPYMHVTSFWFNFTFPFGSLIFIIVHKIKLGLRAS